MRTSFFTLLAALSVILANSAARAQPNAESTAAPAAPPGAAAPAAPPGPQAGDAANVAEAPRTGNPSKVVEPPAAPSALKIEVYGALLPFLEYVTTNGATPVGFAGGASQVEAIDYTGLDAPPRFRMTPGTSNIGFRGTLDLFEHLKLTWQVESGVPLDGTGPPNTLASRNSHIGFTGGWGTLIWGNWETPYKWATLVTINPIKGGFVTDYTSILSTPGFGVAALNMTSLTQGPISNASFYRREPNSVQYWSPTVAGFSTRLNCTINEERPSPADVLGRPSNPYNLSGYLGFDGGGLRVRYAAEWHHDYFGMYQLGGTTPQPSDTVTTSDDVGHQLTIQYALTLTPAVRTRLVGTGELLSYESKDSNVDAIDRYSRAAYYALFEQTVFDHRLWVAYGQSFAGECRRVDGGACSTAGLGARLASVGYLYAIKDNVNLYLAAYRILNSASARHSTFPPLNNFAPGSDVTGIGMGIFYSFGVGIGR